MAIYVLCPHYSQQPIGGVRKLYRHAEILDAAGFEVAIVHGLADFRPAWFEHDVPILYPPLTLGYGDVVVMPEVFGDKIATVAPGVPRVVANQNAYLTFHGVSPAARHPYSRVDFLLGVFVVSEDSAAYLRYAFPSLRVWRIRYGIDPGLFYLPDEPKRRQVALMPRKRPGEAQQVLGLLRARGASDGWEVVRIAGRSEEGVAAILRESSVFLSFSEHEGFGLPPAEAMACGCYVIGYHGFGGREFFHPRFSRPIPDGDVLAYARAAEQVLMNWSASSDLWLGAAGEASRFIREMYPPGTEEDDVVRVYEEARSLASRMPRVARSTLTVDDLWLPGGRPPSGLRGRLFMLRRAIGARVRPNRSATAEPEPALDRW